ncbi:hypothetical protein [Nocardiopsis sp. JB363]|uniref:hypothetical protein n=1 Tax=Nocardiopsis sp. JB363 TaxID=1434837 RepID=UPI00097A41CD|nr:hypothetical protein [Nocardiopsis sp. JB363]SIO90134.1 hypothetical protein BQ8420_25125 [Nocardiopsis sp. JB363]
MTRIDDGTQEAAQALRTEYPHAQEAAPRFALAVKRHGVLRAWTDLMGAANHAPDPDQLRASAELRDGLAPWWKEHGAPSAEPRAILTWLIGDQSPQQLEVLRARLMPVLEPLTSAAT